VANEVNISISLRVSKNGGVYSRTESFTDDMTGDAWTTGVVDITTSGVQLTDLEVGTYGWIFVKNLATGSDYVDIQSSQNTADDSLCRLYAGESSIIKSPGLTALWADSSSGTQAVEYAIIEL
jgi:hypothetical protein